MSCGLHTELQMLATSLYIPYRTLLYFGTNQINVILYSYARNNNDKSVKTSGTTSITTRLDGDTMRELQDEANRTGITLSNLVKQILTNYARWDKFVSKAGMIPVAKRVISEAFDRLNEDEVVQLATSVGKNAPQFTAALRLGSQPLQV